MLYTILLTIGRCTATVEAESADDAIDKFWDGEIQENENESVGKWITKHFLADVLDVYDENGEVC